MTRPGSNNIAMHQIGQDQAGFIEFARAELRRG